ncbi:acyltransferase family protein [Paenibacillus sp. sgz500958]|uniref:acyltransferase family protein n=1 Tax=Paenibacillus sp. sgz500958 TaxID=3242475 RepID=UPI0036D24157
MRNYYPGITLFKVGGCLLVLLAHVILFRYTDHLPQTQLYYFFNVLKIIVPCFYVISGFLVYKGWSHAEDAGAYVRRYLIRFGGVYALFCLAFALEHVLPVLIRDGLTPAGMLLQSKILFIVFFLKGPYVQLWFMPPLFFAVWVSYLLHSRFNPRISIVVMVLAFAAGQLLTGTLRIGLDEVTGGIHLLQNSYGGYVEQFAERYLGYGITFVSLGIWIGKLEERFLSYSPGRLFALTVLVILLEALPLYLFVPWRPEYALAISMLPGTLLLFRGVLGVKARFVKAYHPFINLFSMVTFFGHIPLMRLNLLVGSDGASASTGIGDGLAYIAVTLVEIVLITLLMYRMSRRGRDTQQTKPLAF